MVSIKNTLQQYEKESRNSKGNSKYRNFKRNKQYLKANYCFFSLIPMLTEVPEASYNY